jgi:hypothetical protein
MSELGKSDSRASGALNTLSPLLPACRQAGLFFALCPLLSALCSLPSALCSLLLPNKKLPSGPVFLLNNSYLLLFLKITFMKQNKNRLIILSGPSCVGKSPLVKAFARFYPELAERLHPLVLYNSRTARPGETDGIDYHFRPRHEIAKLKELERFVVMDIRGDLQALDVKELTENLEKSDVLFEGNPFTGRKLQTHPALMESTV